MNDDRIIMSDANKEQYLMIKVWGSDLFDCPVTIKWNGRPRTQKYFSNTVAQFTKHLLAIETFEAASGGASKRQGYKSTNTATKYQTVCVAKIKKK